MASYHSAAVSPAAHKGKAMSSSRARAARRWIAGLLCIMGLGAFGLAQGAQGFWTATGPEGGAVVGIAVDPLRPQTMYLGLCAGRVLKSENQGATWKRIALLGDGCVGRFAVNPRTPEVIYAVRGGGGVFKTSDGGNTWNAVNTGLTSTVVRALAIDPLTPNTLYAGLQTGLFKTTDGGESWEASGSGLNPALGVGAIAIDPVTPSTVYASTSEGLFKSVDAGASWEATGLADQFIRLVAVDPNRPATLYAGTVDVGLVRSHDGGVTWNKVGPAGLSAIRSMAIDAFRGSVVYVATDHGASSRLYRSTDNGDTWSQVGAGLPPDFLIDELRVDPSGSQGVFAATFGAGVFGSLDLGASFTALNRGVIATDVQAIAVDASSAIAKLYAGTFLTGGLFRSIDGGSSWLPSNEGITHRSNIAGVAVDPFAPATVYAGTDRELVRSRDSGATWQTALATGGPSVGRIVFDPLRPGTLYIVAGSLRKSVDGGNTWIGVNPALNELRNVAIDPVHTDTLYLAAQFEGVFKSLDGGATWSAANNGLTSLRVAEIAVNPRNPQVLYAATQQGAFKSSDGAGTWTALQGGLPAGFFNSIAVDPLAPANVYAGGEAGVFKSADAGATWNPLNQNLEGFFVNTVVVHPKSPHILYAGTRNGGLFSLEQPEPGTTDPGSGVIVQPIDTNPAPPTDNPTPVTVTFGEVTSGGTTTVTTSGTGTPPPSGLKLGNPPVYYEISTTASATGPITICINYTGIAFGNESKLKLHHNEGGQWVDVTSSLDTVNDVICGVVSSLSPFALFEPEPYAFQGFFAPVSNAPAVNSVRAGSAVPVKFSLSGDKGLAILKPGYPVTRSIPCSGGEPSATLEETETAGQSGLRYDAAADQYVYTWKTDAAWKGTCRRFELGLNDESDRALIVQFPSR